MKARKAILTILISFAVLGFVFADSIDLMDDFRANSLHKNPANLKYIRLFDSFLYLEGNEHGIDRFVYNNGFLGFSGFSYIYDDSFAESLGVLKYQSLLFPGKNFALGMSLNIHLNEALTNSNLWFTLGATYHFKDIIGLSFVYNNPGNIANPCEGENFQGWLTLKIGRIASIQGEISFFREIETYGGALNFNIPSGAEWSIYAKKNGSFIIGASLKTGFDLAGFYYGFSRNDDASENRYSIGMYGGFGRGPEIKTKSRKYKLTISGEYSMLGKKGFFSRVNALSETVIVLSELVKQDFDELLITIRSNNLSYADIYAVSEKIREIRGVGRKVIAYLPEGSVSFKDYFLALEADEIYAAPEATLFIGGIYSDSFYYKGILNFFKIDAQFVKPDDCIYKSAPETYTEKEPTPPALENRKEIFEALYNAVTSKISERRGIEEGSLKILIDNFPILASSEAEKYDLIEGVYYEKEFEEKFLKKAAPMKIPYEDYSYGPEKYIAVVEMKGMILSGNEYSPLLGDLILDNAYEHLFNRIEKTKNIRSVVLIVDSPGGDAFASERINYRIKRLKEKGKKVYIFFSHVAASGGYYISVPADIIYATPFTITGSIGIFSGKFYLGDFYKMIKINPFSLKFGENADIYSPFEKWGDKETDIIKKHINIFYDTFKLHVSEGRKMAPARVSELAGGRVYLGEKAKQEGLIDDIGSFDSLLDLVFWDMGMKKNYGKIQYCSTEGGLFGGLKNMARFPSFEKMNFWMLYLGE